MMFITKNWFLFGIFFVMLASSILIPQAFGQNIEKLDFDKHLQSLSNLKNSKLSSNIFTDIQERISEKQKGKPVDETITIVLKAENVSPKFLDELKSRGVIIELQYGNLIQAKISFEDIEDISNLKNIQSIREPMHPTPDIVSEGASVIGSDQVNSLGNTGSGIKVAIIDIGFDITDPEIASRIVEAISFRADNDITGGGSTNHGTAVAQIVLDVAPDAQLYLYNINTDVEMLNLINFLINNRDIDVVSMSLSWFGVGAFDGTSDISQAVANARNNGILWVNSAGNSANRHYMGQFFDGDADGFHEYFSGDETIQIDINSRQIITIFFTWNETWGLASTDYDLYVYKNNNFNNPVAASTGPQSGAHDPVEAVSFIASPGTYHVVIHRFSGTLDAELELFSFNQNFAEYIVSSSSISIPADSTGSFSIGAFNWNTGQRESFSSLGPTNDGRIKPDLLGPDGVTTSTLNPFFGTSASAPYAAGAAALTKSANPGASPVTLQQLLEQNTSPNHPKNNNDGTGNLDVTFLLVQNNPPTANAGADQTVDEQTIVSLDGSGSTDPENDPLTFSWQQIGLVPQDDIARLKLEDNLLDTSSSGGNDGTAVGTPVFVDGNSGLGRALELSSTGATQVDLNNEETFDFPETQAFSISVWFKTSASTTQWIAGKADSRSGNDNGYSLWLNSAGRLTWKLMDGTGNTLQIANAGGFNDGLWHHAVGTYDGSGLESGMKLYADKVVRTSSSITPVTNGILNNDEFSLGAEADGGAKFTGEIDELRVYPRVVSQSEVYNLFNDVTDITLTGANTINPTFTAPDVAEGQTKTLEFQLTVTDTSNNSDVDSVVITALPQNINSNIQDDIARLKLEDNLLDTSSSGGNDGTAVGTPVFVDGNSGLGRALELSSTGATQVDLNNEETFDFPETQAFSISVWFKTSASTTQWIAGKADSRSGNDNGYSLWLNSAGRLTWKLMDGTGNTLQIANAGGFNDGLWHHAVGTYDGSGLESGMKLYADKVVRTSSSITPVTNGILNNDEFSLGAEADGGAKFTGEIDELRAYDRKLSGSDVQDLFDEVF